MCKRARSPCDLCPPQGSRGIESKRPSWVNAASVRPKRRWFPVLKPASWRADVVPHVEETYRIVGSSTAAISREMVGSVPARSHDVQLWVACEIERARAELRTRSSLPPEGCPSISEKWERVSVDLTTTSPFFIADYRSATCATGRLDRDLCRARGVSVRTTTSGATASSTRATRA